MKFTIDVNEYGYCIYNSKEEYDADDYSEAGHDRRRKLGPANWRHSRAPTSFPCLAIHVGTEHRANGPDEEVMLYFYDFKAVD